MQQKSSYLLDFEKTNNAFIFFLYYIPYKELNVYKMLKIMGKSLFRFSSYSHPEIWKFEGVTPNLS
jgi:hypothetical protein